MNRDDIIRMAREAGIVSPEETGEVWCAGEWQLHEFAALVAAAEREACADITENWRCNGMPRTVLADQIRARGSND
jgi:hypothetical protein